MVIAYPLAKRRGDWRAGVRPSQPSSLLSFWGYPTPLQQRIFFYGFIQKNVLAHVHFFTTWSDPLNKLGLLRLSLIHI